MRLSTILSHPFGHFVAFVFEQMKNQVLVFLIRRAKVCAFRNEPLEQFLVLQRGYLEEDRSSECILGVEISATGMKPRNAFTVVLDGEEVKHRLAEAIRQVKQRRLFAKKFFRKREVVRMDGIAELVPGGVSRVHKPSADNPG